MPRSSSARTAVQTPLEATAARARQVIALRDVDVAPENLRAGEPPDDDIPLLADTLLAAGQLQPITVRPGRRREPPFMALDGRRRLLALRLLLEQGRIDDGFPVDAFVETDPGRQAAAVVLTNTAVPVHIADVIAAIGRLLKARLAVSAIAGALGYAEVEVKCLAALAALPEDALSALKAGRLTLRQARLLARLPDAGERQEMATAALEGRGFADWRVTERLDASRIDARDPRCALVPPDRYAEAGGRLEADLFGERPPVLLDPTILTALWEDRVREIAAIFEAEGLAVHVDPGGDADLPAGLAAPRYVHGGLLPADEMTRYRDARAAEEVAAGAVQALIEDAVDPADLVAALVDLIRAAGARSRIAFRGRTATDLVLTPSRRHGLTVAFLAPDEPDPDVEPPEGASDEPPDANGTAPFAAPRAPAPEPDLAGVGHALHAVRTDMATRGLIRALADHPRTALTALIGRLFLALIDPVHHPRSGSALTVAATAFAPRGGRVIPALDGVVRERLDARRAAWEASGGTLLGWVHGLDDGDRLAFLAELTALSLDLREDRTSLIRGSARSEAAELAAFSGADLGAHWTPDAPFLTAHPKALLSAMLAEMGKAAPSGPAPGKADLVALVEATAAARRWVPAALSWTAAADASTEAAEPDGAGASQDDDGVGAFVVTPQGQAALARTPG